MLANSGASRIRDRKDVLPAAIFVALFCLMFRDFFFEDKTLFDRDVTLWEVPARKLCTQLLRQGGLALWTDAYGGGQPFLANLKNAVLYPANLFYLCLPFFAAFKLYYFIHVLVTWTGIYFLGKSYALSRRASFLAASLFLFGGMYLSSFEFYNHIAALAWMPWILVLLVRPVRHRLRWMLAVGAMWTLSILAGAPEITLITLTLAVLQTLFLIHDWGRRLLLAAASLCLAVLISAVQLIPSFELWKESGRSSTHYSEWSLEAVQLLNLPFANVLGSDREPGHQRYWAGHFFDRGYPLYYSLYLGLGAIVLAAAALGASRDRRTLFLGLAAILFLVLASGGKSPLSGFLTSLPLISSLRYPVKFFIGFPFSISLLAGIGFQGLFNQTGSRKRPAGPALVALAGFGLLLAALSGRAATALGKILGVTYAPETAEIRASLLSAAILGVVLALAIAASRVHDRARRVGPVLVIGLILLDLVYHNRNVNPLVSTSFFRASNVPAAAPRPLRIYREDDVPNSLRRGSTDIRRLARYARETGYPLTGIGDGLYYLFDEDTLDIYPPAYRRLANAVKVTDREARVKLLRAEGCGGYISHTRLPGLSASPMDTSEGTAFFHRLTESRRDVHIVHNYILAATPEDKIRTCLATAFDPERAVMVDRPPGMGAAGAEPGNESAETVESRQGLRRCRVALSQDGILVFPGNFARGWKARIDDRPADVFAANLSSKGIFVPAGKHRIELRYSPSSFRAGALISGLALFGLAVLICVRAVLRSRAAR